MCCSNIKAMVCQNKYSVNYSGKTLNQNHSAVKLVFSCVGLDLNTFRILLVALDGMFFFFFSCNMLLHFVNFIAFI